MTIRRLACRTASVPPLLLLLLPLASVAAAFQVQSLGGVTVRSATAAGPAEVDLGAWLARPDRRTLLVFGTYAADFNAIEYAQRLRYYWPRLRAERGLTDCALVLNCGPAAAQALAAAVELPPDVQLLVDPTGAAGRAFGVSRGWLPDAADLSPYLKLFGMLLGLGAWATLPAVIGGYLGNPLRGQPWIVDALAVGQRQGRWPDAALELRADGSVAGNRFDALPLVGGWPRRPLELATLRLQSMLGISLARWRELAPDEAALAAGVLTQLGGCLVTDRGGSRVLYEWRDPGICAVANFEDILEKI